MKRSISLRQATGVVKSDCHSVAILLGGGHRAFTINGECMPAASAFCLARH